MRNLTILLLILTLSSCKKQEKIPAELSFSFEYLNKNWDKKEIELFKSISENDTTPRDYHFGIGMHLRNNLLRHNTKSDSIVAFFNDLGVDHYDYMSGIILTSYHRYLNKTEIRLKEQVNEIIEQEKPYVECKNRRKEKAMELYSKFKINDSIQIQMPVSIVGGNNSVVSYECPRTNWEFDNYLDLAIDGVITDKYVEEDSFSDNPKLIHKYYYFRINVLKMNNPKTHYFMEEIGIGDNIGFSLEYSFKVK